MDLNMVSSVFRSLISFQNVPEYCLVFYVQAVITTTRFFLKLSSLSAKLYTVDCYVLPFYSIYRHNYLSMLLPFLLMQHTTVEFIFLLSYIDFQRFCFTLFYIKLWWNFVFLANIKSVLSCIFKYNFLQQSRKSIHYNFYQQQNLKIPNSYFLNLSNTRKWSNIRDRPIMVR